MYTSVNTVRPPNRESCQAHGSDGGDGTYTVASRHPGGAHVAMGDGSVKFITESIDAGDQTVGITAAGMASPHGVWGAMGSAAGGEVAQVP